MRRDLLRHSLRASSRRRRPVPRTGNVYNPNPNPNRRLFLEQSILILILTILTLTLPEQSIQAVASAFVGIQSSSVTVASFGAPSLCGVDLPGPGGGLGLGFMFSQEANPNPLNPALTQTRASARPAPEDDAVPFSDEAQQEALLEDTVAQAWRASNPSPDPNPIPSPDPDPSPSPSPDPNPSPSPSPAPNPEQGGRVAATEGGLGLGPWQGLGRVSPGAVELGQGLGRDSPGLVEASPTLHSNPNRRLGKYDGLPNPSAVPTLRPSANPTPRPSPQPDPVIISFAVFHNVLAR